MSTGNLRDQLYALMEEDKRVHEEYVQKAKEVFDQCKDDELLCPPELEVSVALFVCEREILNDTFACLASIIFSLRAGDVLSLYDTVADSILFRLYKLLDDGDDFFYSSFEDEMKKTHREYTAETNTSDVCNSAIEVLVSLCNCDVDLFYIAMDEPKGFVMKLIQNAMTNSKKELYDDRRYRVLYSALYDYSKGFCKYLTNIGIPEGTVKGRRTDAINIVKNHLKNFNFASTDRKALILDRLKQKYGEKGVTYYKDLYAKRLAGKDTTEDAIQECVPHTPNVLESFIKAKNISPIAAVDVLSTKGHPGAVGEVYQESDEERMDENDGENKRVCPEESEDVPKRRRVN